MLKRGARLFASLRGLTAGGRRQGALVLPERGRIVVIGGGPAGSFFAIRLLRKARDLGRSVEVVMLEKKTEVCFYGQAGSQAWEGCNYCAGGISPRLADALLEDGLSLPSEVIVSRATEVIVHGDWKSIQIRVPENRRMLTVFRGSRPISREGRYTNLDAFLLQTAIGEGAQVVTRAATSIHYGADGRPVVGLQVTGRSSEEAEVGEDTVDADFVLLATGVNRSPGMALESDPLLRSLQQMIPRLQMPKVRRALIAELRAEPGVLEPLEGEVHFAQSSSQGIDIEMASLIPKGQWMTVALLGKSIDRAAPSEYLPIVKRFVDLPHIRLLLPPDAQLKAGCCCHPNMSVGAAKNPFGHRVALAGDIALSRLYKDGLYSAYVTASALADCVLQQGVDHGSLARHYRPVVGRLRRDNLYGRLVFVMNRRVFARSALSRIFYQGALAERMTKPRAQRRLPRILWAIVSGDDSYRHILAEAIHPASLWVLLTSGVLGTLRDKITESVFGLDWSGIGRYPVGVPVEEVSRKREHFFSILEAEPPAQAPEVERMFSIRIRAGADAIFSQLLAFGDPDRTFFTPRFIRVGRLGDDTRGPKPITRYHLVPVGMSFDLELERMAQDRYLLYRIRDGYGRGGIFAFEIEELKPQVNVLTCYVGFDFYRGEGLLNRLGWGLFQVLFPAYAHDVLWNIALCKLKHVVELGEAGRPAAPVGSESPHGVDNPSP